MNNLLIDGIDAQTFGITAQEGAWDVLTALPTMKVPTAQRWQEHRGEEIDFSAPRIAPREVEVRFICRDNTTAFLSFLRERQRRAFHVVSIGRTFFLRFMSANIEVQNTAFSTLLCRFSEDEPLSETKPNGKKRLLYIPHSDLPTRDNITIDSHPLTDYGAYALQGWLSQLTSEGVARPWHTSSLPTAHGQAHDNAAPVVMEAFDLRLPLLFRASLPESLPPMDTLHAPAPRTALEQLWQNEFAFFQLITAPNLHTLHSADLGKNFHFYYKSSLTTRLILDTQANSRPRPWHEMEITLCIVD